jgi:hypothetical protein
MTRVGLLHDTPRYIGGAERTMQEFADAAPEGVKVIACQPGEVARDLDAYLLGNVVSYTIDDLRAIDWTIPTWKYHNDVGSWVNPQVAEWVSQYAKPICCSPLQAEYMDLDEAVLIPPPIDLQPFYEAASRVNGSRAGAVAVGSWRNYGKGAHRAYAWGAENGGIEIYGEGEFAPPGSQAVAYEDMPDLLARFQTFVHLPSVIEPFGRGVVEAWAAGCQLVTNELVGALYWIREAPDKLETAADDLWKIVLDG